MRHDPYIRKGGLVQDCSFCNGESATTEMRQGDGASFNGVWGPENPLLVYKHRVSCRYCKGKGFEVLKTARELEAEERAKRKKSESRNTPDKMSDSKSDTKGHDASNRPDYGKTAMVGTIFGALLAVAGSGSVLVGAIVGAFLMVTLVFVAEIMKLGLIWFFKGVKSLILIALSLAGLIFVAGLVVESLK